MIPRYTTWLYALLLSIPASLVEAQPAPAAAPPVTPLLAVDPSKGTFVSGDRVSFLADKAQGWSFNLKLAANLNVASNRDVVGQLDGNSVLFGANIMAAIGYLKGPHEWLNTASLVEAWSKTPAIKPMIKSNDQLDFQSIYNFFINEYTGPFVRLALQTAILKTERLSPTLITYEDADTGETLTRTRLRLSDSFQPFTINESVGWFAQPVHSARLNVIGRAGFGGRHTFAEGARAIADDKDTANTEFKVLKDVHQAGAELFAGVDGKELEGRVVYSVGATALFPLLNNDNTSRNIAKLTRVQLLASVGMGIFSWMSINYQLRVLRDVQLVDAVQIQNALLLSFQYQVSSPEPKPAAVAFPPEATAKIEELEKRATDAEARATAAESRTPPPQPAPITPEPSQPAPATP
jgi:hypothetical protein